MFLVDSVSIEEDCGWKTTPDQIKYKVGGAGTDPCPFRIYRVPDGSQLNKIKPVPGTVTVIEDSREIQYVDEDSELCRWGGNSTKSPGRWAGRILRWNGADLHWACASTVSFRTRCPEFYETNELAAADIVEKIISETGLVKQRLKKSAQRPRKLVQRSKKLVQRSKKSAITDGSGTEDLLRRIDDLQVLIGEWDLAFARLEDSLDRMNEENFALRAQLQAITGTPSHTFHTYNRPPSSLASAIPDGPNMCLGDVLYAPPSGDSDQTPPRDQPAPLLQYLQLYNHFQAAGDSWSMGGIPQHPTFNSMSSSVSRRFLVLPISRD